MAKENKSVQDDKNKQKKSGSSDSTAKQDLTHKSKSLALVTAITAVIIFAALGLLSLLDNNGVLVFHSQAEAENSNPANTGSSFSILEEFPQSVPVYQPAELISEDAPEENQEGDNLDDSWNRRYRTDADTDTLIGYYEDELSKNGWEITDSFESNEEVYSKSIIARNQAQQLELTAWISEHPQLEKSRLGLTVIKVE